MIAWQGKVDNSKEVVLWVLSSSALWALRIPIMVKSNQDIAHMILTIKIMIVKLILREIKLQQLNPIFK